VSRRWLVALIVLLLGCGAAASHPMPNSVVTLGINETAVIGEITIPLIELDLALGTDYSTHPVTAVPGAEEQLKAYIGQHVSAATQAGASWYTIVHGVALAVSEDATFPEVVAEVTFTPPASVSTRDFVLAYDAVMHQVVTHYALVSVSSDWGNGVINGDRANPMSVGTIRVNPVDGSIAPLAINLSQGSYWQGVDCRQELTRDCH
jgi:hypothetical protein